MERESGTWRCLDHGKHCKGIEYLEKGQDEIKQGLVDKTNEIKDARKSLTQSLDALIKDVKRDFVTKAEFNARNKVIYLAVSLIVIEAIKRYLT